MRAVRTGLLLVICAFAGCGPAAGPTRQAEPRFTQKAEGLVGEGASFKVRVSGQGFELAPKQGDASLAFSTYGVDRQDGAAFSPAKLAKLEKSGAVSIPRGEAVEELHLRPEGLEQLWRFERAPSGSGELVVRVVATGMTHVGQSAAGHRFRGTGGAHVRYGHATWIDAAGVRTPIEVTWERNELRMVVSEELLASSAYPAVLDPVIYPEWGFGQVVQAPAPMKQFQPASAFNGANHLVVWKDSRPDTTRDTVYAARVSPAGQVLDPAGIQLWSSGYIMDQVAVAAPADDPYGSTWLVAWVEQGPKVMAALLKDSGDIAAGPMILADLTGANVPTIAAAAATSGTGYLVAWDQGAITGALVDSGGFVSPSFMIDGTSSSSVAASFAGGYYLVSFQRPVNTVSSWLIDPSGDLKSSLDIPTATLPLLIASAANLDTTDPLFAVLYSYKGGSSGINGRLLAPDGTFRSGNFNIANQSFLFDPTFGVTGIGSRFQVLYSNYVSASDQSLRGRTIAPDGTMGSVYSLIDAPGVQNYPAVSFDPNTNQVLAVWKDERNLASTAEDLYAAQFQPENFAGPTFPVATVANSQMMARAAWSPGANQWLVVWVDQRNEGAGDIYAARLDWYLNIIDWMDLPLSTVPGVQSRPQVASDGTDWYVIWQDSSGGGNRIRGTTVSANGLVGTPGGAFLTTGASSQITPALAWDGAEYFVVWSDGRNSTATCGAGLCSAELYGAHVSSGGTVRAGETNGVRLTTLDAAQDMPALAASGSGMLLTWDDYRSGGTTPRIWGQRFATTGAKVGTEFSIAASNNTRQSSVASDGNGWLVSWESGSNNIIGALVSSTGAVGSAISVGNSPMGARWPSVAYDGVQYWAVWQADQGIGSDILGTRIHPSTGAVIDAPPLVVGGVPNSEQMPAIARGSYRTLAVTLDVFDDPLGAQRGRIIHVDDLVEIGQACVTSADCRNGNCADGVCCDQPGCTGCRACRQTWTGYSDGVCAQVTPGTDPHGFCADSYSCTTDSCSGSGGCSNVLQPTTCMISNACYSAGAFNPDNACQTCQPTVNQSTWYNSTTGASCGTGQVCYSNTCQSGCYISGQFWAPGSTNPSNSCESCVPATNTNSWTVFANGFSCEPSKVCSAGTCQTGCYIGGQYKSPGTPDPTNACRTCQPALATGSYSNADGISCTPDSLSCTNDVCSAGTCTHPINGASCAISGACYATDQLNPYNSCEKCSPSANQTTWTTIAGCTVDAGSGTPDAGTVDAGTGTPDAGTPDAGTLDAGTGTPDAGTVDAGTPDAGAQDAGSTEDAGSTIDAGSVDAGSSEDAGSTTDAGATDAGETVNLPDAGGSDAGQPDGGEDPERDGPRSIVGCSCNTSGASSSLLLLALLGFAALSHRRRVTSPVRTGSRSAP